GLGFGKTVTHNLLLMQQLDRLVALGQPVVLGPSRKSFIGWQVDERLAGTLACVASAAEQGAHVVRVHDVKATVQFLTMWRAIHDAAGREHRPRRHRAPSPARIAA
ncbi:MAG: dihydropteroate synthase, partial [Candidatus Omnitrophica bacterium]|nr:dihydropteroate synthase [Candidatus Omnitrophota bacterium]